MTKVAISCLTGKISAVISILSAEGREAEEMNGALGSPMALGNRMKYSAQPRSLAVCLLGLDSPPFKEKAVIPCAAAQY